MAVRQQGIAEIRIYDINENIICSVLTDGAVRVRELMVSDLIRLNWESVDYLKLESGAHIYYGTKPIESENPAFYLSAPYEPTHKNEQVYTYSPEFHGLSDMWRKYPCCIYGYNEDKAVTSRELEWSFLGTPADALKIVEQSVENETGHRLNQSVIGSVKQQGSSAVELSAQGTSIFDILNSIAQALDTDWYYDSELNYIVLGECRLGTHYYPLIELKAGIDIENPSVNNGSDDYYSRFYIFGSDKNIAQPLTTEITNSAVKKRLPLDSAKYPEGFMDLDILSREDLLGDKDNGFYLPKGTIYRPTHTDKRRIFPKGLYFDEVYPAAKFYVRSILVNGKDGKQYLRDDNGNVLGDTYYVAVSSTKGGVIWNDFHLKDVIAGQTLEMYFTSGILAGRQFALSAHIKYDGTNTFFYLQPAENGSLTTPNKYMIPQEGDELTFFGLDFGIDSAKFNLEKAATKYLYDMIQSKAVYTIKSNVINFEDFARKDTRFALMPIGQQIIVRYSDSAASEVLRVTKIESALDIPEEMTITASAKNDKTGAIAMLVEQVETNKRTTEEKIVTAERSAKSFAERTLSQVSETITQVNNYFTNYSQGITPASVVTMQLVAGDESLQFVFAEDWQFKKLISPDISYDKDNQRFQLRYWSDNIPWFYLKHMTLGVDGIMTADSADKQRKAWKMHNLYTTYQNDEGAAFAYLKCPVNTDASSAETMAEAELLLSTERMLISDGSFYYLLLGFLNAPDSEGNRSFAQMYGYTEVLPGRVTTEKIVSDDGKTYFNLKDGEIGGNINFKDSVISETILIKDRTGKYVGGISGSPKMPAMWVGAVPTEDVETAKDRGQQALDELNTPVVISKEGVGSKIGVLRFSDEKYMDAMSENGMTRISTRPITTEIAELTKKAIPDAQLPSRNLTNTLDLNFYIRNMSTDWTLEKTVTSTATKVISLDTSRNVIMTIAELPHFKIDHKFQFSCRYTSSALPYYVVTYAVYLEKSLDGSTWNSVKIWSFYNSYTATTTTLQTKSLTKENDLALGSAIQLGECKNLWLRWKLTERVYMRYYSNLNDSLRNTFTDNSILDKGGKFHFRTEERANVFAEGGMIVQKDTDNKLEVSNNADGLTFDFTGAFVSLKAKNYGLSYAYLSAPNGSHITIYKFGPIVSFEFKIVYEDRNSTALVIPATFRPFYAIDIACLNTSLTYGTTIVELEIDGTWIYTHCYNFGSGQILWGHATYISNR